jgi:hypothetical protein
MLGGISSGVVHITPRKLAALDLVPMGLRDCEERVQWLLAAVKCSPSYCTGPHPACLPVAIPRHPYGYGGGPFDDDNGNAGLLWVHFLLVVLYCAYTMWLLDGHYKW